METKKEKLLLIGWEVHLHETMLLGDLQKLSETFDIVFASYLSSALDQIAKAQFEEKQAIRYMVFNRNTLAASQDRCRLVFQFAETYCKKHVLAINMLFNDQDSDARNYAVSAYYSRFNDWKQVKVILDNAKGTYIYIAGSPRFSGGVFFYYFHKNYILDLIDDLYIKIKQKTKKNEQ